MRASGTRVSAARVARLRPALLRWYRRRGRRLPWRQTRDPYAIWISEAMLQQTRVETVLRYWPRFLRRFPTLGHLARAREDSVLAAWSGLGYYSRARSLRQAARVVMSRHDGAIPADAEALRALPGVGRYTAGAVASIAFGIAAPVVDGNVARVLARLFAVSGDPRAPAVSKRLWELAASLVPRARPGDWNQALMELGATVCRPRSPACDPCPLRAACAARRRGAVARFPQASRRPPTVTERRALAVVEHEGYVLLVRQEHGRLLRDLYEFPGVTLGPAADARTALRRELARLGVARDTALASFGSVRHTILNRRIETLVFRARARQARSAAGRWVPLARLSRLPLSAAGIRVRESLRAFRRRRCED